MYTQKNMLYCCGIYPSLQLDTPKKRYTQKEKYKNKLKKIKFAFKIGIIVPACKKD